MKINRDDPVQSVPDSSLIQLRTKPSRTLHSTDAALSTPDSGLELVALIASPSGKTAAGQIVFGQIAFRQTTSETKHNLRVLPSGRRKDRPMHQRLRAKRSMMFPTPHCGMVAMMTQAPTVNLRLQSTLPFMTRPIRQITELLASSEKTTYSCRDCIVARHEVV